MNDIIDLLNLISDQNIDRSDQATLIKALSILDKLSPGGQLMLNKAFLEVTMRAIETRLLSDRRFRRLSLYWDSLIGEAESIIITSIRELTGVDPPQSVIKYIRSCIQSHASRSFEGSKSDVGYHDYLSTIKARLGICKDKKLRCECCGYHFRPEDIGNRYLQFIYENDGILSTVIHPNRLIDTMKPWQIFSRKEKPVSLTHLSIDHRTPEFGHGWTAEDNLSVSCKFCNDAKGIYRRPLEAISPLIAGSLSGCPQSRGHTRPRQIAIVAIIFAANGTCAICGAQATEIELTIEVPPEFEGNRWMVPWVARPVCYNCFTAP